MERDRHPSRSGCPLCRVGGLRGGQGTLEAKMKGQPTVTLAVSVHPRRSFKVAFFFLPGQDAAGNVKSRTAFTPSAAAAGLTISIKSLETAGEHMV